MIQVRSRSTVLGGQSGYKYQFNHFRQRKDEVEGLAHYDGSPQTISTTWSLMHTPQQLKDITDGKVYRNDRDQTRSLDSFFDESSEEHSSVVSAEAIAKARDVALLPADASPGPCSFLDRLPRVSRSCRFYHDLLAHYYLGTT